LGGRFVDLGGDRHVPLFQGDLALEHVQYRPPGPDHLTVQDFEHRLPAILPHEVHAKVEAGEVLDLSFHHLFSGSTSPRGSEHPNLPIPAAEKQEVVFRAPDDVARHSLPHGDDGGENPLLSLR
jgi:hypothetical protein